MEAVSRSLGQEKVINILITGGSGFVGQELIKLLVTMGHSIINVDLVPSGLDVEELVHDLTVSPVMIEADFCFHLASATGGLLFNQHEDVIEYNAKLNANVLTSTGSMPMVFVSTLNVFEGAQSVKDVPSPSTPYAKSKLQGETFFLKHAEKIAVVRPCNIFGASQISQFSQYGESHVIPDILHKIQNAESTIEVWGDGSQKRGFLHVADMCSFLSSLLTEELNAEYNICSSIFITISKLIDELIQFSGKIVEIKYNDSYMKYEKMFIGEIVDELEDVGIVFSIIEGITK